MNMWMIITVDTELDWPSGETTVSFMERTLILRPPGDDAAPDVRLQYEHPDQQLEAFDTISRFLTAMSWWYRRPARARLRIECTAPMRGGKVGLGPPLLKDFQLPEDIPSPSDQKARIALALYREALSVENVPYEFLGYFKIINVVLAAGKDQITWINNTIPHITGQRALTRISALANSQSDIGEYLYVSGRCAVAHASTTPVVDPDNPADLSRLSADMPVARALAEYLIENEFGIKWRRSS